MEGVTNYELIKPRRTLTRKQKSDIFVREHGICHICEEKIDGLKEKWDADHVNPRGITGKDTLDEYKPAHLDCHKIKTKEDVKTIAKCNRIRANNLGAPKAKSRPIPGSKASGIRKKMNGTVQTKCDDCGANWADWPSKLCPGCEAYQAHQG